MDLNVMSAVSPQVCVKISDAGLFSVSYNLTELLLGSVSLSALEWES